MGHSVCILLSPEYECAQGGVPETSSFGELCMFKTIGSYVLAGAMVLGAADTAMAQRQSPGVSRDTPAQTINFTFGGFFPKSFDSRADGDVLVANCDEFEGACSFFDFDTNGFKGLTFGGEYLIPIGQYIEAGTSISYYKNTVDSRYALLVADDPNTPEEEEDEILQDLSMQQVPLSFTVRVLPLGATNPIQPYVGGGINVSFWSYKEEGEFVDEFSAVFRDTFKDSGTKILPTILAGIRFATSGFSFGGEFRWQTGTAELDPTVGFLGPELDLGGYSFQATFGVRFD